MDVCPRPQPAGVLRPHLGQRQRTPHLAGEPPAQARRLLGRAGDLRAVHRRQSTKRFSESDDVAGSVGAWRDRSAFAHAAVDHRVSRDEPAPLRSRMGNRPAAVWRSAGRLAGHRQPHRRHRAMHGRLCVQWEHPRAGVSLAELEQHLECRLQLARDRGVRDRGAQHEVRLPGRLPGQRQSPRHQQHVSVVPVQQRGAESIDRVRLPLPNTHPHAVRGALRPGAVDARPADAARRGALRQRLELRARSTDRADQVHPDSARLSGAELRQLERHHPQDGCRLRRVRDGKDRAAGQSRQVL